MSIDLLTSTDLHRLSPAPSLDFGMPAHRLESQSLPAVQRQLQLKRVADFTLALLGILVLSPLFALIALLIRLTSPGPILYKSERIGQDYQSFPMYKFRTMVPNADQLWDALRKDLPAENGLFKLKNDSRITPLGQFLRKYSLDEFPQLLNVLKGEMSLVGPRPFVPKESSIFQYPYTARFSVLPGMTGPWQVSGRSDLTFEQLCHLELKYVMQWNLLTDLTILLQTLPSVLLKKGAY